MTAQRQVTHLVEEFVRPSEAWLYDVVTAPTSWQPSVLCERRLLPDSYPFDAVADVLPRRERFRREWWVRQANKRLRLPVRAPNYWAPALRRYRGTADVFHAHFGHAGWMAVDAGLEPVVTSFYGFDATNHWMLGFWGRNYPALFAGGAAFVVEGPAMGKRLTALGAPEAKVRVLPLLADVDHLTWRSPTASGALTVLMAGRFVEKKGFDLGLLAFDEACRTVDASLVIMGNGPTEDELRGLVRRLDLGHRVSFVPFGDRDGYRRRLAEADVLLQPSRTAADGDGEGGAPTTLLDAQAIGTVVVASDHADIPFVLDPGAAYLCREGDVDDLTATLRRAIDSRDEWPERSARGRRHVERQHGLGAVVDRLGDIYAEAAS